MTKHHKIPLLLALLTALYTASGCSAGGNPFSEKKPQTMDATQARTRIDTLLNETFQAIKPPLKWHDGWYNVSENTSGINDRPDGTAHINRRRYVMTKVSQAKFGALLGTVERYWKKEGYTITSVDADKRMPGIYARTQDGNRVSIEIGYWGNVTFIAGVPYIPYTGDHYPFGYGPPQPTTTDGDLDIDPKFDDPFWSH